VLFVEVLRQCVGQTILLNDNQERTLLRVEEDFLVLQGGNPQLRLTEFIPFAQITRMIRGEYAGGSSSLSLDLAVSASEIKRDDSHF
jgi:hypothetical protein